MVCVYVPATQHGNIVLEQRLREMYGMKKGGVAGGWTKLRSDKVHDLYWWENAGGWWTERQWDRRKALEILKMPTEFQFEAVKWKGKFKSSRPRWKVTDSVMNWT